MARPTRPAQTGETDRLARLSLSAIARLLGLARPELRALVLAGVCALLGSAITLSVPLIARAAVNEFDRVRDAGLLDRRVLTTGALVLLGTLFGYAQFVIASRAGNRIVAKLREDLYGHLLKLPTRFYDRHRSGDLAAHLTTDVVMVQDVLVRDAVAFPGNMATLFGGIAVAIFIDWRLCLIVVGLLGAACIFFVVFGRALRRLTRQGLDALALTTGGMSESLANVRLVKAFAREAHETDRARVDLASVLAIQHRAAGWEGLMGAIGGAGFFLVALGVLWYGGRGVISGALTPGDLLAFLAVVMVIAGPMGSLASLYTKLQRAVAAADRVFALLDEAPETPDRPETRPIPEGPAHVSFRNVDFGYDERPVLRDFSLELPPGEVVALVGASGAGKSTVASLLFRLYEPTSGEILWNGVPITQLPRRDLREAIGLVPQDASLFSGTLRDNIRYGRLNAADAEIEAAAREANVHEFAQALPQGYDTLVGERGVTLSGGQKQRVAIARAILKNPRVLVLDEATSALDQAGEALVQDALNRLMEGRTSLVVAHRLSTVERADEIAVLRDGRIVERGAYAHLLAQDGAFTRLARNHDLA